MSSMNINGSTLSSMNGIINFDDTEILKTIRSNGLVNRTKDERYNKFCRIPVIDPYNSITTTREYIFITKPDLHIFDNRNPSVLNPQLINSPIFVDALSRYNDVLKQLQLSSSGNSGPFINLLSNTCKSTMDIPGINSDDMITAQNILGTKMFYRESSYRSDQDYEFNLEFEDTKFLEVYMFFKLYDEYERLKYEGSITPPDRSYIMNRILHDQMSIYKIIVGDDGENILFFAKGYGVYPKMVPRDAFSDMNDGTFKFSVTFKGTFIEDLDPTVLADFNSAVSSVLNSKSSDISYWDSSIQAFNGEWCTIPYIKFPAKTPYAKNSIPQYKLKWR